jgi:hypothetical protein
MLGVQWSLVGGRFCESIVHKLLAALFESC